MQKISGYAATGAPGQFPIPGAAAPVNSLPAGILASDGYPIVSTNTVGSLGLGIPGAAYNGTTNDRAALNTFITAAAGAAAVAWIIGPMLIGSNITIPANIQLAFIGPGLLKPAVGVTLTINGPITAGAWKIFDLSNSASVINGTPRNEFVLDAWWGTDPTGAAQCGALFNKAFVFAHAAGDIPVRTVSGTYNTSDASILVNGVTGGSFTHPNWIGSGSKKTIISYPGLAIGAVLRGGSGQISHGYLLDIGFAGDANSIGLQFDGQCGSRAINCRFDTNFIGTQWANIRSGSFTEYCTTSGCEYTNNCQFPFDFTKTTGNNSFHGSGPTQRNLINIGPSTAITLTATPAVGDTSNTLSGNWTLPSGAYSVLFSSGEVRMVTLASGANTATWASALTLPASTSAFVGSYAMRIGQGCNLYNAPFDAQIWSPGNPANSYYGIFQNSNTSAPLLPSFVGELSIEGRSGQTFYLGEPNGNAALFVSSPVRVNALTNGPGNNVLPGAFMRVNTVGISFDSTVSFTGGKFSQFLSVTPTIKVVSPLSKTHRIANVEINIGTSYIYHYTLDLTFIQTGSTSVVPKKLDCFDTLSGSAPYTVTGQRFSTDANSLGAPSLTGNTDGSWNIVPPTAAITFSGAPSGTSTTLNANWTKPNGTYPITFSDGEIRNVVLTNGAATADWSADYRGALTGSPTTAATVSQWPITGISIYVTEWQQSTGATGGGHHLF